MNNPETSALRAATSRMLDDLLDKVTSLRLDLLRTQQAYEAAVDREGEREGAVNADYLSSGDGDLASLASTIRRCQLQLDSMPVSRDP